MNNEPDFTEQAIKLLELLESDFCQSGRDIQIEAIRCELEAAYQRGFGNA
jgi:hypothetical protein